MTPEAQIEALFPDYPETEIAASAAALSQDAVVPGQHAGGDSQTKLKPKTGVRPMTESTTPRGISPLNRILASLALIAIITSIGWGIWQLIPAGAPEEPYVVADEKTCQNPQGGLQELTCHIEALKAKIAKIEALGENPLAEEIAVQQTIVDQATANITTFEAAIALAESAQTQDGDYQAAGAMADYRSRIATETATKAVAEATMAELTSQQTAAATAAAEARDQLPALKALLAEAEADLPATRVFERSYQQQVFAEQQSTSQLRAILVAVGMVIALGFLVAKIVKIGGVIGNAARDLWSAFVNLVVMIPVGISALAKTASGRDYDFEAELTQARTNGNLAFKWVGINVVAVVLVGLIYWAQMNWGTVAILAEVAEYQGSEVIRELTTSD